MERCPAQKRVRRLRIRTNELRKVLLSWCGETETPPKTVVCDAVQKHGSVGGGFAISATDDETMAQGIEVL